METMSSSEIFECEREREGRRREKKKR